MADPIIRMTWIRRQHLREHPNWLFVFGDNLAREGFGGQAGEMRGEPNAVGIPTKKRPSMHPGSFFTDADLVIVKKVAAPSFERLRRHVKFGGSVVIPANGIGTGMARLDTCAPTIFAYINEELMALGQVRHG